MIKAFMCGVSKYTFQNDLEFCKNDALMFSKTLINNLNVTESNIKLAAENGEIDNWTYMRQLKNFCSDTNEDDLIIIYFSGHGGTDGVGNQFLCAINTVNESTYIDTEYMVEVISQAQSKTKLIILDCCHADSKQEQIGKTVFDVENAVDKFYGSGCAVFSSCKSTEKSYPYDTGEISAFTKFICDALSDKHLIKNGCLYFNDFKNLVQIYAKAWSRKYPDKIQTPVLRSNVFGTIVFPTVNTQIHQKVNNAFKPIIERNYDIINIEFSTKSHSGNDKLKAYSATIVLKTIVQDDNSSAVFENIINKVRNVYMKPVHWQQEIAKNQPVDIVWLYIANDMLDVEDGRYLYTVVWANKEQDYWLNSLGKSATKYNEYSVIKNDMYEYLKNERLTYTLSDRELIEYWSKLINSIISKTEEFLNYYREYQATDIDSKTLSNKAIEITKFLNPIYDKADNVRFTMPNSRIKHFDNLSLNLSGTSRGLMYLVANANRTEQNLVDCFEIELKNYYSELRNWVEFKKEVE